MACESLEIFDILLEMDMPIIAPYVKDIIEFSLAVSNIHYIQLCFTFINVLIIFGHLSLGWS